MQVDALIAVDVLVDLRAAVDGAEPKATDDRAAPVLQPADRGAEDVHSQLPSVQLGAGIRAPGRVRVHVRVAHNLQWGQDCLPGDQVADQVQPGREGQPSLRDQVPLTLLLAKRVQHSHHIIL